MSDDLGVGEVGWYPGRSNTNISTPNIDALAASGMRFLDAWAGSPVCAPSRGTLLTGLHTGHATIRGNDGHDGEDLPLAATDVTFFQILKAHGYHVSCVGKWGLGFVNSTGDPIVKGCTDYYGVPDQNDAHNMYPSEANFTWRWPTAAGVEAWESLPFAANVNASRARCMGASGGGCIWSHDLWTNAALAALSAHTARALALGAAAPPLFLYLAWTDPHAGGWGGTAESGNPVPSDGAFASAAWPPVEKDHASVISNFQDRDVGTIVQYLETAGLRANTAVFFASDNGASNEGGHDYAFFDSSASLRGFKRCLTEGGLRTPLLASWPGVIPAGSSSSFPTAFYDLGNTILDLAGVPQAAWLASDGRSVSDVLRSPTGEPTPGTPTPVLYAEFCTAVHPPLEPRQGVGWGHAVRWGAWKAVSFFADQPLRLYNLTADVYETHDLAASFPAVVAQMEAFAKAAHVDSPIFPVQNCLPS